MTGHIFVAFLSTIFLIHNTHGLIDTSECEKTKGCFFNPSGCSGADCTAIATWKPDSSTENVQFELQGKINGWVALGFSEDSTMGGDSVVECIWDNGNMKAQISYNPGRYNEVVGTDGIKGASGKFEDGILQCTFSRVVKHTNPQVFDLDKNYTLLLGIGSASGGSKSKHIVTPFTSNSKIDVTSSVAGPGGGVTKRPLLRAHGILMMSAWTLFVCTAILLARYYKNAWPGTQLCKKPIWFAVHQAVNISVLFLTVIAFILIFVDVKGYTMSGTFASTAHPIAGIIVTILAITNPVMAIFRPAPDAEKRFIFNWLHWGVGTAAHILSVFTIYLGMSMATSFTPVWTKFVLIAFDVLYIIAVLVLEFMRCQEKKASEQEMEMHQVGAPEAKTEEQTFSMSKYIVLVVFLTAAIVLYLAMLIPMATG